jgi:very-short-patch-repair endonuclease
MNDCIIFIIKKILILLRKTPEIIKEISRKLRKEMTKSELILWEELKSRKLD